MMRNMHVTGGVSDVWVCQLYYEGLDGPDEASARGGQVDITVALSARCGLMESTVTAARRCGNRDFDSSLSHGIAEVFITVAQGIRDALLRYNVRKSASKQTRLPTTCKAPIC